MYISISYLETLYHHRFAVNLLTPLKCHRICYFNTDQERSIFCFIWVSSFKSFSNFLMSGAIIYDKINNKILVFVPFNKEINE